MNVNAEVLEAWIQEKNGLNPVLLKGRRWYSGKGILSLENKRGTRNPFSEGGCKADRKNLILNTLKHFI